MSQLIPYTTDDGMSQIQLCADLDKVWLTQLEMAELINATKQNNPLHRKKSFDDGELCAVATAKNPFTVQKRFV